MTIGERIKKIRVFRKMTMDELGGALGFEGKNMSVRISQYETGARIPGEDMILKLADALHCNYKAISDYSLGAAEDIIETLFWLEESATSLPARGKGTRFPRVYSSRQPDSSDCNDSGKIFRDRQTNLQRR